MVEDGEGEVQAGPGHPVGGGHQGVGARQPGARASNVEGTSRIFLFVHFFQTIFLPGENNINYRLIFALMTLIA